MVHFCLSVIVYRVRTVFSTSCPTIVIKEASTGSPQTTSKSPTCPVPSSSPGLTEDEQKQLNEGININFCKHTCVFGIPPQKDLEGWKYENVYTFCQRQS